MADQSEITAAFDTLATAIEIRVLSGKLRRRLREASDSSGLPDAQRAVLMHLDREGPMTVTALAQAERMRSQSMGAIVTALVETGLVDRAPDPHDGRRTILTLTAEAHKTIRAIRAAREDWLGHALQAKLTVTEQRQLAKGVELLKRLVD